MDKPTRTIRQSETLIDHIISNCPQSVKFINVLPCSTISDHDAPYACIDIRVRRFAPTFKYIRNERQFNEESYVEDCANLPLSVVYALEDPNEKLDVFSGLILQCIERHAPLKRTRLTRPPAPWLQKDEIRQTQLLRDKLRFEAHATKAQHIWQKFRDVRNLLKKKIREARQNFINKALSSKKPKEVWQVIYRILHPNPTPLRCNVDALNEHFASTATRTTGVQTSDTKKDLIAFLDALQPEESLTGNDSFTLRLVTFHEVLRELKHLRSDTSTGPDLIPTKFLKPTANILRAL